MDTFKRKLLHTEAKRSAEVLDFTVSMQYIVLASNSNTRAILL